MSLLGGAFRDMAPALALSLLDPQLNWSESDTQRAAQAGVSVSRGDGSALDAYDLKRLHAYASSLVDYHLILDLLQPLARAYMAGRVPTSLSYGQVAILLCLGLQVGPQVSMTGKWFPRMLLALSLHVNNCRVNASFSPPAKRCWEGVEKY